LSHVFPRSMPVRVALTNQRDDLLAFAGVPDEKLAAIAQVHGISAPPRARSVRAASLAEHLDRILAGVEPASSEARRHVPCGLRCRQPGHGRNTAQQFTGGKPQLAAAHLLHAAPPLGRFIPGLAAVLPEPSVVHAQPMCRAQRQEPTGIDDRPRPSALAYATGPRVTSAPASLNRGGWSPPHRTTFELDSGPQEPAVSGRPCNPKSADSEPR
jgi:hypothetical protein